MGADYSYGLFCFCVMKHFKDIDTTTWYIRSQVLEIL